MSLTQLERYDMEYKKRIIEEDKAEAQARQTERDEFKEDLHEVLMKIIKQIKKDKL